jgi:NTE family protein
MTAIGGPRCTCPVSRALALTLSGGGFRAIFAALGAIRMLAGVGRLSELRYTSSVSGGSVANGLVAAAWSQLRRAISPRSTS